MVTRLTAWTIAIVFCVSALAKAGDRQRFAETIKEMGVPAKWSSLVATTLLSCEFVVVALLLPLRTARAGGRAAAGLMALFTSAASFALVNGKRPSCNCFGNLSQKPLAWKLVPRNMAIGSIALLVSGDLHTVSRSSHARTFASVAPRLVIPTLVFVNLALGANLLRKYGQILNTLDDFGLSPVASTGAARGFVDVPVFDLQGQQINLSDVVGGASRFNLFFSDLGCRACGTVLAQLEESTSSLPTTTRQVIVLLNTPEEVALNLPSPLRTNDQVTIVLDKGDASVAYAVNQYPSAILYEATGAALSPLHSGPDSVIEAIERSWELDKVILAATRE